MRDTDSERQIGLDEEDKMAPNLLVFPERQTSEVPVPDHMYHLRCANIRAELPHNAFLEETNASADLGYDSDVVKFMMSEVEQVLHSCVDGQQVTEGYIEVSPEGETTFHGPEIPDRSSIPADQWLNALGTYVEQHFLVNKKAVIERDTDLLTPEEITKFDKEVVAAMITELKTWLKYGCFTRRKRSEARNIVDCKWVLKWKHELLPDGTTRRIIRARLTIRGFKDLDKAELIRYAGTSQRYSQRLLVSEAANRGWPIACTDISKAFLQGVTYDELSKMTGEPLRDVSFYLPPSSIAILKQLPGYENFNPALEVLWCVKPGTGSVDAPRAFQLKLSKVTRETCKLIPTKTDAELLTFHKAVSYTHLTLPTKA